MDSRVGIFLVADNRLLREALTRILSKKPDIAVLGAIPYSAQAIDQIVQSSCDVLLLDVLAATGRDLESVRRVRQILPDQKIVLIGMEEDDQLFLHAVRTGVVGYVLKEASASDVVSALRAVANEEAVCPPRLCLSLFRCFARQTAEPSTIQVRVRLGLTRREHQLLPFLARGLTNKEIASALNLSEQTVKNHLHRMMQKVGAENRLGILERCQLGTLPS